MEKNNKSINNICQNIEVLKKFEKYQSNSNTMEEIQYEKNVEQINHGSI